MESLISCFAGCVGTELSLQGCSQVKPLSLCVPLPPTILLSQACSECHSTWFCLRGTKQSLACIASQVFWVLVQKSQSDLSGSKKRKGEERQGKAPIPTKQKHRLKTTTIGQMNCLVHPLVASCLQFLHKSQNTSATSAEQKKPSF